MIYDRIENAGCYRTLGPGIAAALDYCAATDFARLPDGRYEIDGDFNAGGEVNAGSGDGGAQAGGQAGGPRLLAIVQRYRPKPLAQIAWEAHRKYIDVQYVVAGAERMGHALWSAALEVRTAYDPDKDVALFDAEGPLLEVRAGSFAVFFPHDVHAPSLAPADGSTAEVLKVVVKVAVG
jgi:biofilm protein TabA